MVKFRRIDFVGNANNYPLLIAHALREQGYDVHMHLLDDYYLNDPKVYFRQYEKGYPSWMHDWRPCNIPYTVDLKKIKKIRRELANADGLVLNSGGVFFGAGEKRPTFCLLTGTDLLTYANFASLEVPSVKENAKEFPVLSTQQYLQRLKFVFEQRAAIATASGYSFFPRAIFAQGSNLLEEIGADLQKQYYFLITEVQGIPFSPHNPSGVLRVLVGARCTWDRTTLPLFSDLDYKGTDIFLYGANLALKNGAKLDIHMFRKGAHIEQTMKLIQRLNLNDCVTWHEEVSQADFLECMKTADVVVDNLGSSHIGMVSADAFALGRPVIARSPDHTEWKFQDPFPVCHADTAEDVAAQLCALNRDSSIYQKRAQQARGFAEKYFHPRKAAQSILEGLAQPKKLSPQEGYLHVASAVDLFTSFLNNYEEKEEQRKKFEDKMVPFFQMTPYQFKNKIERHPLLLFIYKILRRCCNFF